MERVHHRQPCLMEGQDQEGVPKMDSPKVHQIGPQRNDRSVHMEQATPAQPFGRKPR